MSNEYFDSMFSTTPVMAILRGMGAERTLKLAHLAWDLGIESVEVPIQSPRDLEALRAVAAAGRERGFSVGAGTVVTVDHVSQAVDFGAAFAVSPGTDRVIVQACLDAGLPQLPGVATASDIQLAASMGLGWVKAFPASVLGTAWLKAMKGPFPGINFVATGGMDAHNAGDYLGAGAKVVAVGSALEDPLQLELLSRLAAGRFDSLGLQGKDSTNAD